MNSHKRSIERPTGIIRTLPYNQNSAELSLREAYRKFSEAMQRLLDQPAGDAHVVVAMAQKPTKEVLHCYLLLGGKIRVRLNIAGFEPGDARECWDGSVRRPKYWMILTAPVSYPPSPIKRSGFQGFRYIDDLW